MSAKRRCIRSSIIFQTWLTYPMVIMCTVIRLTVIIVVIIIGMVTTVISLSKRTEVNRISAIVVPCIICYITFFKEFRLQFI